jgi:hypothetical protein
MWGVCRLIAICEDIYSIHLLVLFVLEGIHFKELVTKMDDGSIPVMVVQ